MIKIRTVKVSDWEEIKELLESVVHEIPPVAIELEPLIMKGKRWLADFPKGEAGNFVVAEINNKIVAFCYLAVPKFYRPVAYIGVVVAKEYRKKDIGSQMFYHVAEWAASQHLEYIIADVWHWNLKSLKFFEKMDFIEKTRFKDKFRGVEEEKVRLVKKL